MDADTLGPLISGGAGLLGALIGGSVTLLSASRQRRWQAIRDRRVALRDEEQLAARKCEELCIRMADEVERMVGPSRADHEEDQERREDQVHAMHAQLLANALYLPDGLRDRVELLGNILDDAHQIVHTGVAFESTHYDSTYTIAWHVKKEVRPLIAAFLQDRPLPAPQSRIGEYRSSLSDLDEQRREYYEMLDSDSGRAVARQRGRDVFYRRHPEHRQGP